MRKTLLSLIVVSLCLALCSCGRREDLQRGGKVVAKINDYELTDEDFKDEARLVAPNKYLSRNLDAAKEELLEEMITKHILLQEAQRQNFDKDKAFMKEIERYWAQALLKLLIKKKTEEFSRNITVEAQEVRREYEIMAERRGGKIEPFERISNEIRYDIRNKKLEEALDGWVRSLRNKANMKIFKENLKDIRID